MSGAELIYHKRETCPYCKKFDPTWKALKKDARLDMITFKTNIIKTSLLPHGVTSVPKLELRVDSKNVIWGSSNSTVDEIVNRIEHELNGSSNEHSLCICCTLS